MARATAIINALLWIALGCFSVYAAYEDRGNGFMIVVGVFGATCILSGFACILKWRMWRVSSRVLGVLMILYGLDVLLLGHGEDVGGAGPFLILVGGSVVFGVWSVAQPFFASPGATPSHGASPNGGPTTHRGDPGVPEGPPSVS